MFGGNCFRCGEFGHVIADCPEFQPPGGRTFHERKAEHERRLKLYRQRLDNWLEGNPGIKWTPEEKTRAIEAENRMYEKVKAA